MTQTSHWMDEAPRNQFPALDRNLEVDVVIIGGGITGVTAAFLLKQAGKTVALLERDRCGQVDTGHTTAHLTFVTDSRLSELVNDFGRTTAQATWDAGRFAIERIRALAQEQQITCGFRWVSGYLHAPWKAPAEDSIQGLKDDANLATELGFPASFQPQVPFANRPGVLFLNQAKFHPLQYLAGLVKEVPGAGSHVFEQTEVTEVTDSPLTVKAGRHTIRCQDVIIATHVPLMGKTGMINATLFQTKLASYSSYVIGARLPLGTVPEGLFWDTSDPYYYLRVDRNDDHDYVIFGGEDHKTGQTSDPEGAYRRLESLLMSILPAAVIDRRWTGQVVETHDGLPFIGEIAPHQFIATGFSGNGMTFGTLAAQMAADALLGRRNPWKDIFAPTRNNLRASAWDYVKENMDYPYYLVKSWFTRSEGDSIQEVPPGEGRILNLNGQRVAVHCSHKGEVTTLSPVCTHMGCLVRWNGADATWDCPCHGSRFKATGEVLAGPAETPLAPVTVEASEPAHH